VITYEIARAVAISDYDHYEIPQAVAISDYNRYRITQVVAISDFNCYEVMHAVAISELKGYYATKAVAIISRSIVLDNQCATRHRRHTHDATYDPCRAACSEHTRNRHHAAGTESYQMRRTESGRSPPRGWLSAVGWSVRGALGDGLKSRARKDSRLASCPCHACCRRATSRQARSA
jgi:hypothetical protein